MEYSVRDSNYENYRKKANVFYNTLSYEVDTDWLQVGDSPQVGYYRASSASSSRLGMFHIHGYLSKNIVANSPITDDQPILTIDITNAEKLNIERTYIKYGTISAIADLNFVSTTYTDKWINLQAKLSYLPLVSTTNVKLSYVNLINGGLWSTQGLVGVEVKAIYLDLYI